MARTRALAFLTGAAVPHQVHHYELEESESSYGEAVAATLGVEPGRVFKTLVALVDDAPVVAIVPVDQLLSLKALARAAGGKKATMATPVDAERWTGYVIGGISPFGQKRKLPVHIDQSALFFPTIYVSAGQRGIQVEIGPQVLVELLSSKLAELT